MFGRSKDKERYRELCREEGSIGIFSQDWWLDAVCGEENWDVVLAERGGAVAASLPFNFSKKYRFLFEIVMPLLTQTMGVWMRYPNDQKYAARLSYEIELIEELIGKLPRFSQFCQNFSCSFVNWLPFYWAGYKQTTRYTYVIDDLSNQEKIFSGFRESIKRQIRKAEKRVTVCHGEDLAKFYEIVSDTFSRKKLDVRYSLEFLKRLDGVLVKKDARRILFAKDDEGRIHAAIYLVWDQNSAYYLAGGGVGSLRESGATSLLMWEGIKFAAGVTKRFDFEGSMIPSVERFFRSFGAMQRPFFTISRIDSRLIKLSNFIRELAS